MVLRISVVWCNRGWIEGGRDGEREWGMERERWRERECGNVVQNERLCGHGYVDKLVSKSV